MTLGNRIRHNTAWIMGGSAVDRVVGFVVGIILARLLVPEDFGLVVTIQIFTGIVGFLASGGLGEALVQAKTLQSRDYDVVFTAQLAVGILIFSSFFTIAPWFAAWFDDPRYQELLKVSALSFLIRPFTNVPQARLRREMRFKAVSLIGITTMLVTSATSISMAALNFGPWALVVSGLFGAALGAIMFAVAATWRPAVRFDLATARRLGGYGIRVTTNEVIVYMRNQTSNLLVSGWLGPATVGLFNKARSVSVLPVALFSGPTYQTVFRALSSIQENRDQSKYVYLRTATLLMVYTLPFLIGLFWLAEPFIVTLYGANWQAAAAPLQILLLGLPFVCIGEPAGAVCAAQDLLGKEIRIQLEGWVILILGVLLGLEFGLNGVAWGLLPGVIYVQLRVAQLANGRLGVNWVEVLRAARPSLVLNGLLVMALLGAEYMIGEWLRQVHGAAYLLGMTAVGGSVYTVAFLFAPLPELVAEANRWKVRLHLKAR